MRIVIFMLILLLFSPLVGELKATVWAYSWIQWDEYEDEIDVYGATHIGGSYQESYYYDFAAYGVLYANATEVDWDYEGWSVEGASAYVGVSGEPGTTYELVGAYDLQIYFTSGCEPSWYDAFGFNWYTFSPPEEPDEYEWDPYDPNCWDDQVLSTIGIVYAMERTPPRVSISGPFGVPVGTINSVQVNATGVPSGGSYAWSVLQGSNNVGLQGGSSGTVTVVGQAQSSSSLDVLIQVVYTQGGVQSTPKTHRMTVQKPSGVYRYSQTNPSAASCPSQTSGPQRWVTWQVIDQFNGAIGVSGMPASDVGDVSLVAGQNGCNVGPPTTGSTQTDGNGRFPDQYFICAGICYYGGSCTALAEQVITVNGYRLSQQVIGIQFSCSTIVITP